MSRAEQTEIPGEGFERKVIADIETAANAYRNARDERMEMTKLEVVRRDELIAVMQQHETQEYVYVGPDGGRLRVKLKSKLKVSVRQEDADDDDSDEDTEH